MNETFKVSTNAIVSKTCRTIALQIESIFRISGSAQCIRWGIIWALKDLSNSRNEKILCILCTCVIFLEKKKESWQIWNSFSLPISSVL